MKRVENVTEERELSVLTAWASIAGSNAEEKHVKLSLNFNKNKWLKHRPKSVYCVALIEN